MGWTKCGDLRTFNLALLGKWLWRYATEREAYWRSVVEVKYGCNNGGWCTNVVEGPYGVGVWKQIRRGWEVFSRFISFEIGDGSHIRFWHDNWCGNQPLKETFPKLFWIACNKEAWVKDHMQLSNGSIQWNVPFIRAVQDWEVEVVTSFFGKLYTFRRCMGVTDCMLWF
jgi:hypothetical protein